MVDGGDGSYQLSGDVGNKPARGANDVVFGGGDQGFALRGTAALTGMSQLGYHQSSGDTIIRGSTDGDATSEFEIQLVQTLTPTQARFDA